MKRILITGITGYIGSNLAQNLLRNGEIYGLVRKPLNLEYLENAAAKIHFVYYDGSYNSMNVAIQESRPDLVYHLATYYTGMHGTEDVEKLIASNITLGAYLLEAMSSCKVPALVYATTYMTHYRDAVYCPVNLYAATKQAFSALLAYYTDAGFLRAATLVLSDTYGPDDHRPKVLNLVKRAAITGEAMAFSDGGQEYDVVHIDDVVRAFRMAGEELLANQAWKNEVFQVYSRYPLTLRQTVEQMLASRNLTLNAEWGKRPPPEREIRKAVRLYPAVPGWEPEVKLSDGLSQF